MNMQVLRSETIENFSTSLSAARAEDGTIRFVLFDLQSGAGLCAAGIDADGKWLCLMHADSSWLDLLSWGSSIVLALPEKNGVRHVASTRVRMRGKFKDGAAHLDAQQEQRLRNTSPFGAESAVVVEVEPLVWKEEEVVVGSIPRT